MYTECMHTHCIIVENWKIIPNDLFNVSCILKRIKKSNDMLVTVDVLFNSCVQVSQKERPPMHEYIRKLLYKDLSKTTTEKVNDHIVLYIYCWEATRASQQTNFGCVGDQPEPGSPAPKVRLIWDNFGSVVGRMDTQKYGETLRDT